MPQPKLLIDIGADASKAIGVIRSFGASLGELQVKLKQLQRDKLSIVDLDQLKRINQEIATTEAGIERIGNIGKAGFDEFGEAVAVADSKSVGFLGTLSKQKLAFLDIGRVIEGQSFSLRAISSNFALFGPVITIAAASVGFLISRLTAQTDAEKKAADEAEHLQEVIKNIKAPEDINFEAIGSQAGDIARVQALADAIKDTNKSYAERKTALDELRATNKNYFGDLSLEASSLKTLTDRVQEYSKALITEAIIKGQTEEIANMSKELQKQIHIQDQLKDARDRADSDIKLHPSSSSAGNVASGGADDANDQRLRDAKKANDAFKDQRDNVEKLRSRIAAYTGELDKNIAVQLKLKPLTDTNTKTENEFARALQELKDYQNKVSEIDDDAEQKELDQNDATYEKLKAKLKGHHAALELLEEVHQQGVLNIQQKYADKLQKLEDEINKKRLASEIEGISKLNKAIESYSSKSEDINVPARQKEINEEQRKYDDLIDQALFYGRTVEDLTEQHRKNVQGINDKYDKIDLQNAAILEDQLKVKIAKENVQRLQKAGFSPDGRDSIAAQKAQVTAEEQLQVDKAKKEIQNEKALEDTITQIHKDADQQRADLDNAAAVQAEASINKSFADLETGIIVGAGEAIGAAIASGKDPIEAAGEAILGAIGDFVEKLGKALVNYGLVKLGLDAILKNPIVIPGAIAIALGFAAIAAGSLIKNIGKVKGYATGDLVYGEGTGTSDSIPAMLSAGEFVVTAKAVKKPGVLSLLRQINSGQSIDRGFSEGGLALNYAPSYNSFNKATKKSAQSIQLSVDGEIKGRGNDLLVAINRAKISQGYVS